ncbi:hypothetical protein [Pseudoalteromonas rubra]|uniref:Uncharacterized protein n=1 Tax=Pseudoalteromonas rubra TaxID=43658 RepID=A0A4Q7E7T3_9GAMM|nr:hypothetical protein [Pseudoalteromonas rubra]RZM78493.1 hypothetical protein C3B51_15075 [Pseudoalteromonas rubra]
MNDLTTKQRALSAFKSRIISQLGWHYVAGALSDAMITNMCSGFVRLLSSAEAPAPLQRCAK